MNIPLIDIGSRTKVLANEIVLLEAHINYTKLYMESGQKIIVSYNLGLLQGRLSSFNYFVRPNRQTIVNLRFLEKYNDEFLIINKHKVLMSRRRKELILSNLKSNIDFKN